MAFPVVGDFHWELLLLKVTIGGNAIDIQKGDYGNSTSFKTAVNRGITDSGT